MSACAGPDGRPGDVLSGSGSVMSRLSTELTPLDNPNLGRSPDRDLGPALG